MSLPHRAPTSQKRGVGRRSRLGEGLERLLSFHWSDVIGMRPRPAAILESRRNRLLVLVIVLVISACVSAPVRADDRNEATARANQLLKEGYALARTQKCELAIPRFEQSLEIQPTAKAWLNLARCEEQLQRLREALGHWARARELAHEQGLATLERAAIARFDALEPTVPTLILHVNGFAANEISVFCDGAPVAVETLEKPMALDPGVHVIAVSAEGRALRSFEVTLALREHTELAVAPGEAQSATTAAATPPPAPTLVALADRAEASSSSRPDAQSNARPNSFARPAMFAGFGVAALGILVGSVAGAATLAEARAARALCNGNACSPEAYGRVEHARSIGDAATVAFTVAGIGAATGLFGLWLGARGDPNTRATAPSTRLRAWVAPAGNLSSAAAFVRGEF
jgi:tetratricopeptide (TPR) repeat protein